MKSGFIQFKFAVLVTLLLVSSSFTSLHSQDSAIKWGIEQEYLKQKGFIVDLKILKTDSTSIYFYARTSGFGIMDKLAPEKFSGINLIIKHDKHSGENKMNFLNQKVDEYYLNLLNYFYIDSTIHVFSFYFNKASKKGFVFHETFNVDSLKFNGDIRMVKEIDETTHKGFDISSINISNMNDKFLLHYVLSSKKKYMFGFDVFDKNLNIEMSRLSADLAAEGAESESGYNVDKDGNVYTVQYGTEEARATNKKKYKRKLFWTAFYPKDGTKPIVVPLSLKDDCGIMKLQLSFNDAGKIVCAGLYSVSGNSVPAGCYSFVIEPQLTKITSVNTKEFPEGMLTKELDIKAKNLKLGFNIKKMKFIYLLDDIRFRKDGGFDLVSEKFHHELVKGPGGITAVSTPYYFFDDLYVMSFNADGSIRWVHSLPKFQYVTDNANLLASYFLYRDNVDNMNFIFNIFSEHKSSNKARTIQVTLDKDGNESVREMPVEPQKAEYICPIFFHKLDDNTLLISQYNYVAYLDYTVTKRNKLIFGELNLK